MSFSVRLADYQSRLAVKEAGLKKKKKKKGKKKKKKKGKKKKKKPFFFPEWTKY